jgi:hypothetical protein
MFSSFYKKRIPNFSINSLNNLNKFNNLEFRKYAIESTNQSIQKKLELYKNNPYSKILKNEKELNNKKLLNNRKNYYNSVEEYDDLLWPYIKKYGKDGDFIWNVSSDNFIF